MREEIQVQRERERERAKKDANSGNESAMTRKSQRSVKFTYGTRCFRPKRLFERGGSLVISSRITDGRAHEEKCAGGF